MSAKQKGSKRTSMSSLKQSSSGKSTLVGRWSAEEHDVFILGMQQYPKQWKKIAEMVKTRTVVQIRTHAQKCWNDTMADPKKQLVPTETKGSTISRARLVAAQPGRSMDHISPKNNTTSKKRKVRPGPGLDLIEEDDAPPRGGGDKGQMGVGRRRRCPTAKSSALTAAAVAAAMGRHSIPAYQHMGRQLFNGGPVKKQKGSPRSYKKKAKKPLGRPVGRPGRPRKVVVGVHDSPTGVMSFHDPMPRHYNTIDAHLSNVSAEHPDLDLQLLSCTSDHFITHNDLHHNNNTSMGMMGMGGQYHEPTESGSPTNSEESANSTTDSNASSSSTGSSDEGWKMTLTGVPTGVNLTGVNTGVSQIPSQIPTIPPSTGIHAHTPLLQLKLQQPRPSITIPATPQGYQQLHQPQQTPQSPSVGSQEYKDKYLNSAMNHKFGEEDDGVLAPVPHALLQARSGASADGTCKEVDAVSMLNYDEMNFFNDLLFT